MADKSSSEKPPSLWQVLQSVLAAFFGVQSEAARQRDFTRGKPIHYIIIGLVSTIVFVLTLVLLVKFALHQAGM